MRLGVGIGGVKALAGGVRPTLLAAPLMAAVTASCARGHTSNQLAHAMALALSGASGRVGRPLGAPSGRWFALAQAVGKGMRASEAAGAGFRGDLGLVSDEWLRAQAGHADIDTDGLESSARAPSLCEVGFKPFPIARQGANAVAAFQRILSKGIDRNAIETIEVFVPAMNVALLSRPLVTDDRLSRLSNLGYQLALAALAPDRLYDAERREQTDIPLMEFARRVTVVAAPDLDAHLPKHWPARVVVKLGGEMFEETLIDAPFDAGAPGLDEKLNDKWRTLLRTSDGNPFDDMVHEYAFDRRALLWQIIERRVSIGAEAGPRA
jgi:2-methylcitrate dehydratase PrpD